jgi:chromate transporter
VKVAWPLRANPVGVAIAALCFIAIAVLRLPLLPTMLVLASLSILAAKRWPR